MEPSEEGSLLSSDVITVGTKPATRFLIHFMRTVRVPEDRKEYSLPPGHGSFPLYDIEPFKSRLPPEMAVQGGIFLPMYRKSALIPE